MLKADTDISQLDVSKPHLFKVVFDKTALSLKIFIDGAEVVSTDSVSRETWQSIAPVSSANILVLNPLAKPSKLRIWKHTASDPALKGMQILFLTILEMTT